MQVFTDQTGHELQLNHPPQRIVSLVPSQTELLFDLGLDERVIGITKFCIHPGEWFRSKTRVGGTKQLHLDIIRQLQPDLIIANKEENVKEQVENLANDFPVWISDVNTLEQAIDMIRQIGNITYTREKANQIINEIESGFSDHAWKQNKLSAAYLIWNNPFMTVGHDTFIHDMLEHAGFTNVFAHLTRYPVITIEDIVTTRPKVILLSSEPFPFNETHKSHLKTQLDEAGFSNTNILLVDGEMFSWYGSRLRLAPGYFQQLRNEIN